MRRKPILDSDPIETVITQGVNVKGNLNIEHDIWIDGSVEGNITSKGNVTLGQNGYVRGKVNARNLAIGGQVLGNVRLEDKLAIFAGGRLLGDAQTKLIAIAEGGIFNGQLSMPDADPDTLPPEPEAHKAGEHGQPIE
jgi:cytoskeletal protein CcmA (bactofilin family)